MILALFFWEVEQIDACTLLPSSVMFYSQCLNSAGKWCHIVPHNVHIHIRYSVLHDRNLLKLQAKVQHEPLSQFTANILFKDELCVTVINRGTDLLCSAAFDTGLIFQLVLG